MRVLFVGDTHGYPAAAVAACVKAGEVGADRMVQVGDFGFRYAPGFVDAWVVAPCPVWFLRGNHDSTGPLTSANWRGGLRAVRAGEPVDVFGSSMSPMWLPDGFQDWWLSLVAVGGGTSVDRARRVAGVSWWPDERPSAGLVLTGADVFVSHDCPAGMLHPGIDSYHTGTMGLWPAGVLGEAVEDRELLADYATMVEPRLVVHGHHHWSGVHEVVMSWGRVKVVALGGFMDWDGSTAGDPYYVHDV